MQRLLKKWMLAFSFHLILEFKKISWAVQLKKEGRQKFPGIQRKSLRMGRKAKVFILNRATVIYTLKAGAMPRPLVWYWTWYRLLFNYQFPDDLPVAFFNLNKINSIVQISRGNNQCIFSYLENYTLLKDCCCIHI